MSDLRVALEQALGPIYRVEREVRSLGDCRLFVAGELAGGAALLVKVLPGTLALAGDPAAGERARSRRGDGGGGYGGRGRAPGRARGRRGRRRVRRALRGSLPGPRAPGWRGPGRTA